jgi:transposase
MQDHAPGLDVHDRLTSLVTEAFGGSSNSSCTRTGALCRQSLSFDPSDRGRLCLARTINGLSFRAHVEQVLAPILNVGDIVIMDNLGSHKAQATRRIIRDAGAKLFFLPPHSSDLNPIEQVFSKLKAGLRKREARTVDTVCNAISKSLDGFKPDECANCHANSG